MRRLLLTVVVLGALLLAGDRLAAVYAAHLVAETVRGTEGLSSEPDVAIHGFPFLTQLFGGRYDDVEITVRDMQPAELTVERVAVHLRGAEVPFGHLVRDDVNRIPVDRLVGSVHVSYADLSAAAGGGLQVRRGDSDDTVEVTGTVEAAGVSTDATANGSVTLQGDRVVVSVRAVEVDGQPAPAAVDSVVRDQFAFTVSLPELPFHVELDTVEAGESGITVAAVARDVILRAPP